MTTSRTQHPDNDPPRRKVFRGMALPERPTFALESAGDPDRVEEFVGQPCLPGVVAMTLGIDGLTSRTLPTFFDAILQEEDVERFNSFCRDARNGITIEVLADIAKFLIEEYSARPTEPSSAS